MRLSTVVMRRLAGFPKLAGRANLRDAQREITLTVDAADRARLEAVAADRNRSQKHVWRARIILLTADGDGTTGIERRTARTRLVCGAGRSASCGKACTGSCATKRAPPASRRWRPR